MPFGIDEQFVPVQSSLTSSTLHVNPEPNVDLNVFVPFLIPLPHSAEHEPHDVVEDVSVHLSTLTNLVGQVYVFPALSETVPGET